MSTRRTAWLPPLAVALLVVVLGLANVSGSSIGVYGTGVGSSEGQSGIIVGPARAIRSDEWLVRTPWVLAQQRDDLAGETVGGIGTHDAALISDLPTAGWELVYRPHTLPYHLLSGSRALAFEWWLLYALQFIGVYALVVALTRSWDLGLVAGLLMVLSPVTQWWTGSGTYTTIGYGGLATALLLWAYRAQGWRRHALSAAAGLALTAFAAGLYPPWQVGVALVAGAVGLAAIAPDLIARETRREALLNVAVVLGPALLLAAALVGLFVLRHSDGIAAVADTVYPGQNPPAVGGRANIVHMLSAPFDSLAAAPPLALVNGTSQSENSSGLLYVIPVAVVFFCAPFTGTFRGQRTSALRGALIISAVLGSWMLLPLPAWFGRVTMLDRLEPARAVLPMAFASVLALVLTVFHLRQSPDKLPTRVLLAAVVMFLVPYAWAAGQYAVEGSATNHGATAIMLLVVGLGVGLALAVPTKQYGLAVLLAFGLWQASQINPIQHGTTVLTDNELARSIGTLVGDADRAGSGWVVFAAGAYASGTVTASGVDNLSAVSPYPDVDAWTILDPSREHEEIWNRYAHVAFELGEPGSEPDFSLPNADVIVITIDPCDQRLIDLGVDFLVTPEGTNPGCGHLVKTVELGDSTLLVFKR